MSEMRLKKRESSPPRSVVNVKEGDDVKKRSLSLLKRET